MVNGFGHRELNFTVIFYDPAVENDESVDSTLTLTNNGNFNLSYLIWKLKLKCLRDIFEWENFIQAIVGDRNNRLVSEKRSKKNMSLIERLPEKREFGNNHV